MGEPGFAHNSLPLVPLLEQLRAHGVPICCAPKTWRLARDGYAWQVDQAAQAQPCSEPKETYRLLRVLAVRPGSVTLLVRNRNGMRAVLRTLPSRPAFPEADKPSPHLVRSSLLPCGNVLVREYLRATPLRALLDGLPYHRADRLLNVARRLVAALRVAPVVHWITPSNTFIDAFDRVVFTDATLHSASSVRRLFETGRRSPPYFNWIAPEILHRGQVERASSLAYSVAALLWQVLLGSPPPKHPVQDWDQIRWRLERELATLSGIPSRLSDFLLRNCSPNPNERIPSLEELDAALADLERVRLKPYGSLVALRREGYPWLRDWPTPKPGGTWTPAAKIVSWTTLLACVGFAVTFLLPQDLAVRAARTLGFAPPSMPLALIRTPSAQPGRTQPSLVSVETSGELAAAIGSAVDGTLIRLASPGPFKMEGVELSASVRIVGEEGTLPILLVTDRYGLRVSADRLELENVHIVVLSAYPVESAIAFSGRSLVMRNCSLQTWFSPAGSSRDVAALTCVRPDKDLEVTLDNVYVRGFAAALHLSPIENTTVQIRNTTLAGCHTAVLLVPSLRAGADNAIFLHQTTVLGGQIIEVQYQPGFETGALVELEARNLLALPLDRSTPLLAVHYPAAFGQLLSHLSWSGERVLVPNTARMLLIRFGRSGRAFVVQGTSQWARFWGDAPTGVIGLPLPFAGSLPPGAALRSALGNAVATAGADPARHQVPDVTSLARALERVAPEGVTEAGDTAPGSHGPRAKSVRQHRMDQGVPGESPKHSGSRRHRP